MKFLSLIFITFLTLTAKANWVKEQEILNKDIKSVYLRKKFCPGVCYRIPNKTNASYLELVDIMENDLTKPVMSKTDVVQCVAIEDDPATTEIDETKSLEDDCQEKLAALDCLNKGEAIRAADNSEVYCSMLLRYEQKPSGMKKVRIDETLKTQYETAKASQKAQEQAVEGQLEDMAFGKRLYASVQLLNKGKGLTKAQRRTLRQNLKTMRDDLMDGNICDVRSDLEALAADGTLIREADKTAFLAKIDAYKTCQ